MLAGRGFRVVRFDNRDAGRSTTLEAGPRANVMAAIAGDLSSSSYKLEDMARGDCIFAATGVTDGSLLRGVHRRKSCVTTESIVMRASTRTIRRVSTQYHDLAHRGL